MRQSESHGPTSEDVPLDFAVIIPAHNVENTLPEQLEALTTQRWSRPWGIVVVDNRSSDGTANIARSYEARGVRLVSAGAGRGVAYARNAGAHAVNAGMLAFCDGDDVVHPGWVEAMAAGLASADIVSGRLETTSLNARWLAESRPIRQDGGLPRLGKIGFASGGNCAMRREVFERLGGFDEGYVGLEDIEFSLRALAAGASIQPVPEAVLSYRLRDDIRSVWRQGFYYGRGRPLLIRTARRMGLPAPGPLEGLKSWAWLVVHVTDLRTKTGRFKWFWVLSNRVGALKGFVSLLVRRAPTRDG